MLFIILLANIIAFNFFSFSHREYLYSQSIRIITTGLVSNYSTVKYPYDFENLFCQIEDDMTVELEDQYFINQLFGEDEQYSPYAVFMGVNEQKQKICSKKYSTKQISRLKYLIDNNYHVNFFLNGLPLKENYLKQKKIGWFVGEKDIDEMGKVQYRISNHIDFQIDIHNNNNIAKTDVKVATVVGFHISNKENTKLEQGQEINFTYSVTYNQSEKTSNSYFQTVREQSFNHIIWYQVILSFMSTLAIIIFVSKWLQKKVQFQIYQNQYTIISTPNQVLENWKQCRNEVFKPPFFASLISSLAATGFQLIIIFIFLIIDFFAGTMYESFRTKALSLAIAWFSFTGWFAGYHSARMYKSMGGQYWIFNSFLTCLLFPLSTIGIFVVSRLPLLFENPTYFNIFFKIDFIVDFCLFFFGYIALVFIGSIIAYKSKTRNFMSRKKIDVYQVPSQPWYLSPYVLGIVSGFVCFYPLLFQMHSLLGSMWSNSGYLGFFLWLSLMMLIANSGLVAILITYFGLNNKNYEWQWPAFFYPCLSGLWVFAYSIYYYQSQLDFNNFTSLFMYIFVMGKSYILAIVSAIVSLLSASSGFICSFQFVKIIYSKIHED